MWVVSNYFVELLVVFIGISVSWTILMGAPWFPTSMKTVHTMLKIAEVGADDIVYDLGCGDGRTIITAARRYGARAVGIEIDPLRYIWCQIMVTLWGVRDRVKIVYGNFFTQDLNPATVVTCYLLQSTNNKLEEKLLKELRPGTRVVSNTFMFPTMPAVSGDNNVRLYLFYPDRYQGLKQVVNEIQC
jgi:SAM-dependent methyltransferase